MSGFMSTGWGHNTDYGDDYDDGKNCCKDEIDARNDIVVANSSGDSAYTNGSYSYATPSGGGQSYCQNGTFDSPNNPGNFNNTVCIVRGIDSVNSSNNWCFRRWTGSTWTTSQVNDLGGQNTNCIGNAPVPFSISQNSYFKELQCCSQNHGHSNIRIKPSVTYTESSCQDGDDGPGDPTGSACGDPHITPIFGKKYDL